MTTERLSGIETFIQAVEAGSFALAAAQMRVTRSAVGKSIARLEQRLGVRLFNRTTRHQSLTENGQAYYERCKRALAEIDAAEAALDASGREPIGRLRVSVPLLFGRHCVAPVLSALVRRHPRLDLEISFSDRVVDVLQEGFDLAVRIGDLRDSATFAARRLGVQHFVICAAPSYLAQYGSPSGVAEFAAHTAITYAGSGPEMPWRVTDDSGRLQELAIVRRLRLDDVEAIADAALAGAGLALLPRWLVAAHVRAGRLVVLRDNEPLLSNEIHAIWPHSRYLPSKTRVAVDALAAQVPSLIDGMSVTGED
jgi:DNA-binding transcriptional LysR family regulator